MFLYFFVFQRICGPGHPSLTLVEGSTGTSGKGGRQVVGQLEAVEIREARASQTSPMESERTRNGENGSQRMGPKRVEHDWRGRRQKMIRMLNLMADKMVVPFIETGKSEEDLASGMDECSFRR